MTIEDQLDPDTRAQLARIGRLPDDARDESCVSCQQTKAACDGRRRVQRKPCCARCRHSVEESEVS